MKTKVTTGEIRVVMFDNMQLYATNLGSVHKHAK